MSDLVGPDDPVFAKGKDPLEKRVEQLEKFVSKIRLARHMVTYLRCKSPTDTIVLDPFDLVEDEDYNLLSQCGIEGHKHKILIMRAREIQYVDKG